MEKCYGAYCKCSNCRYTVSLAGFVGISKEEYETLSSSEISARVSKWSNERTIVFQPKVNNEQTERPGIQSKTSGEGIRGTKRKATKRAKSTKKKQR